MTLTISPLPLTVSDILGKDEVLRDRASISFGATRSISCVEYQRAVGTTRLWTSLMSSIHSRRTDSPQTTEKNIEEDVHDKH